MTAATLTEFLLARIAEDEEAARAAGEIAETPWRATYGRQVETARDGYLVTPEDEYSNTTDPPDEVALNIARHDPARTLAECEAKRRIVARCKWAEEHPSWSSDWEVAEYWDAAMGTLDDLAAVYADHADYRDEWKP